MSFYTYHLIKLPFHQAVKFLLNSPKTEKVKGLIHSETMVYMKLGTPIFSLSRFKLNKIVCFAQWENESDFDKFLETNSSGKILANSWYLKLQFVRQWGKISGFEIPKETIELDENEAVVAITIARMKFLQIPRFLKWGRPVEKLVRDDASATLSLASISLPNVISTFSIWKSQKEMEKMVLGHSKVPNSKRHLNAMKERDRKDFHFEFTTLRFRALAEHGFWENQTGFIIKTKD